MRRTAVRLRLSKDIESHRTRYRERPGRIPSAQVEFLSKSQIEALLRERLAGAGTTSQYGPLFKWKSGRENRESTLRVVVPLLKRGAGYKEILDVLDAPENDFTFYDRLAQGYREKYDIACWLHIAECPDLDPERQRKLRKAFQTWLSKLRRKLGIKKTVKQ